MSKSSDPKDWDKITIATPGWMAPADQIADFLRAVFPEDAILAYQRRIAEGALRGAVKEFRGVAERKLDTDSIQGEIAMAVTETILSHFDPDHPEWGGFFPPTLLCPHHDTSGQAVCHGSTPAMGPCPGYGLCRAGMDIRETRE